MTFAAMPIADAIAVEPVGENRYRAELVDDYTVLGYPNGGYLQCVLANAAIAAASDDGAPHIHASSVATNFIKSPTVGPVMLSTKVRRIGRGVSFVAVALSQGEDVLTESLVTVATFSESSTQRYLSDGIAIAPLADCVSVPPFEGFRLHDSLEIRYDLSMPKWWEGEVGGPGEIRAWMRLAEGGQWNALNIFFATDCLPPATLALGSTGWVPTLQLTSYLRRVPSSDWVAVRQWIRSIADGVAEEHCEVFDESGDLVASETQVALVRFTQGS